MMHLQILGKQPRIFIRYYGNYQKNIIIAMIKKTSINNDVFGKNNTLIKN